MSGTVIGFIGTGVMGRSMAGHLLKAGYPVHVYNRTREKARELVDAGAVWEDSPAALAGKCSVIITMVGYPKDVEELYFGPAGIIANAAPGSLLVDMTTSSPALAIRVHNVAEKAGMKSLDAPVSGGDVGARNAALTIMVGGDRDAFESVLPIFRLMGKTIVLQGAAGAGQHTKMANQIAIAGTMLGAVESIVYAEKAGLDPRKVLESIGSGSAGSWSLSNYVPRMLDGDFRPGFYVKHFIKDMKIALDSAREMKLNLPGLALAERLYEEVALNGGENSGTHALYLLYHEGKV